MEENILFNRGDEENANVDPKELVREGQYTEDIRPPQRLKILHPDQKDERIVFEIDRDEK
ncbi:MULTISPECIES: hypothetical protein [Enterococcus]|uniref:Uncharacterized protein n=1 Tax=Enterococcus sulfureus ATCC 49903 TaxID=1140003 RepID=S0LIM3_9ENTE|nr:hypothetical protein [Enterococcus sulfureus]EOT51411.1 hypothetical protein OMY_00124 [Enterococcus sulfureus ATCC 49903]EOT87068.1 hypothetical protein I573_00123 [Enterococcus sulfureus ATCC 49903]